MDRFLEMSVFLAVAEAGSFTAGAHRLKRSPPAVTRTIATLEERLGVRLLERTTRHVRVTEAGQRYLADVRRILAEVEVADDAVAGINAAPRGLLTVTAPVMFGRMHVIPGVVDYLERYPETQVEAVLLDRVVNLLEEGVDVGVRIGELPDSTLHARRVGEVSLITCASPDYFSRHGKPSEPEQLAQHVTVSSDAASSGPDWRFQQQGGTHAVRIQPRLTVTTNDAAIEAALRGLGITRLLSYQVAEETLSGELVRVLEEFQPPPRPIHIVYREARYPSARTRAFVDLLAERLRAVFEAGDLDQHGSR